LENVIPQISNFLNSALKLYLHPNKITIRKYHQGIDFLGYVSFPRHRSLRTKTKHRMFKKMQNKVTDFKKEKISKKSFNQTLQSYLGILMHCNGYKLKQKVLEFFVE